MKFMLTSLLLVFPILTSLSATADAAATPRERAVNVLFSWVPRTGSLGLDDMDQVLSRFNETFWLEHVAPPKHGESDRDWALSLLEQLSKYGMGDLKDAAVVDVLTQYLDLHAIDFRAAYELAARYAVLGSIADKPPTFEVGASNKLTNTEACVLAITSVGATVGGGLVTAANYQTPYGALVGLLPITAFGGWRLVDKWTAPARVRRLKRRALPVFQTLLETQRAFAIEGPSLAR